MDVLQEADASGDDMEEEDVGEAKQVRLDQTRPRESSPRDEGGDTEADASLEPTSATAQPLCSADQDPADHEEGAEGSPRVGEEAAPKHEQPAQVRARCSEQSYSCHKEATISMETKV